jgi:cyanophycinase-like exopeptidase
MPNGPASTPTPTVHLVGGGPGAVLALRRHFKAALARMRPRAGKPIVAYVGAASSDNGAFFGMIRASVAAQGVQMRLAKLAGARASAAEARALLEDADLVFMSGGDVEHGMTVLREKGIDDTLRALARGGKPMFGISAGSLMLAREWVRFPDGSDARAEIFPCLGIAPVHVDAHSEDDGWSELRVLVRLLHERGDPKPVGHGLTRKGGLLVDLTAGRVAAVGTPIPRLVVRRGAVVDGAPLQLQEEGAARSPHHAPRSRARA